MSLSREDAYQLEIAREGKQYRDEVGRPDAKADRVLEYYEAGIMDPRGHGIDVMAQTPAEWIAQHGHPRPSLARALGADAAEADEFTGRRGGSPASNQFGTYSVHVASPKQIAFLRRLIASKDCSDRTPPIKVPGDLDTISKKSASALIDRLMGCPDKAGAADPAAPLATDNQMAFLRNLIVQRDYYSLVEADRRKVDMLRDNPDLRPSKRGASELIEVLKVTAYADATSRRAEAQPRSSASTTTTALEVGVYRTGDGTVYRVYPARSGGHLLAKRVVVEQDEHGHPVGRFEYAGAAGRFVKPEQMMTLEEAKAFGQEFGVCCVCAAVLTDPDSIASGIGPICAGKYGVDRKGATLPVPAAQ